MNQSRGITDLLAAEKKAQDIIDEARRRKAKRIKDAQNEAKSDVDKFKGEREQSYKSIEQQVSLHASPV
jgi:V-type H+-transporting ATPase subunit G